MNEPNTAAIAEPTLSPDDRTSNATATNLNRSTTLRWFGTATIASVGVIVGGYLLGNGLLRAEQAERSVTVRGLAERNVTADLATWVIAYSASANSLADAQSKVRADTKAIRSFFADLGFPDSAIQPTGANVSTYTSRNGTGITTYTVRQRLSLRTTDIERAQKAVAQQFDLVDRGVLLQEGSGMSFSFTGLNSIKPEMVADATRDARASAQQFAKDSGANVGAIKSATQGYFSIEGRDGSTGGWDQADSPYKKVRVVTTVNFALD